ncbi:MAG: carbonic anhydrase [Candidatus Micrarchaeota archaeon]|nr:carbonic anhydrase [Candidatus Micrarchaeota archaeon]
MNEIPQHIPIKIYSILKKYKAKILKIAAEDYPDFIITPETTVTDFHKHLRNEAMKTRVNEKKIKEAESMVMAIHQLVYRSETKGRSREVEKTKEIVRIDRDWQLLREHVSEHHLRKVLSAKQAKKLLLEGNERYVEEIHGYQSHHEKIEKPKEYDVVIIACGDGRNVFPLFRDFINQRILVIQIAGNIYDQDSAVIKDTIKKVKNGGEILFVGHNNCGAVEAKQHVAKYTAEAQYTGKLLEGVDISHNSHLAHDDYEANTFNQAAKMKKNRTIVERSIKVIPCLFDFKNKGDNCFKYLGEGKEPEIVTDFRSSAIARIAAARNAGKDLTVQSVHSIVVAVSTDLGAFTDPRVILDAGLNDIFVVSIKGKRIDQTAIESINFPLRHVDNVKDNGNIVILATSKEVADEISKQLKLKSAIIREKGMISIALYNQETGRIEFLS